MSNAKNIMSVYDISIIGAGPSGLAAAITIAKINRKFNKNISIAIFELNDKIGQSILKTGNGRCNFSNLNIDDEGIKTYYNAEFCNDVFSTCQDKVEKIKVFDYNQEIITNPTLQLFEDLGLACYAEEDGKLFPYTNKASSVVDVLRYAVEDLNIDVYTNYKLINYLYNKKENLYYLKFNNNKKFNTKKLIISSGLVNFNKQEINKNINKIKKVLGPIKTETKFIKSLDGVRVHAGCSLVSDNKETVYEVGEVLFRKYGLSGICIFNLSRYLENLNKLYIKIDFAPEDDKTNLLTLINNRYDKFKKFNQKISGQRLLAGLMLPSVANALCSYADIDFNNIDKKDIKKLCEAIKNFKLKVEDIGDAKQCQVSRGGIKVSLLNSNTLALKQDNNLFFTGEIIDVDGPCGGYNLHWAWTSGILAGISATENI